MKSIRIKVAAIVAIVTFGSTLIMQLINGIFLQRNLGAVMSSLTSFFVIVVTVTMLANTFIWFRLSPLARSLKAIKAGKQATLSERSLARARVSQLPLTVAILNILGFVVGPAISIFMASRFGAPLSSIDIGLLMGLNLSIGVVSSVQQIGLIEATMLGPKESLGIMEPIGKKKDMGLSVRILMVTLSSVGLAAIVMVVAAFGVFHEYSRWIDMFKADAISGATAGNIMTAENEMSILLQFTGLMVFVILWTVALIWAVVHNLRRQLLFVTAGLKSMAEGSSDLTQRVSIANFDEIGELTMTYNKVIANLQSILKNVRLTTGNVSESARALMGHANGAKGAVESMETSLKSVSEAMEKQDVTMVDAQRAIEKLADSIDIVADEVATQAGFVEESSASITEMAASINSVSKVASQADARAKSLNTVSREGEAAIRDMSAAMVEIAEASKAVYEIVGSISKISAQTNLLAMNAAIEAAHAGDAGQGFAVVAGEVRSLAETSAKSAKSIVTLIKEMDSKISGGVRLVERAGKAFAEINESVGATSELNNAISLSMGEQKIGADEILTSVTSLIEATSKIRELTVDQREQSKEMKRVTTEMLESVEKIAKATNDQTESAKALTSLVVEVGAEAEKNYAEVDSLGGSISGFKLE